MWKNTSIQQEKNAYSPQQPFWPEAESIEKIRMIMRMAVIVLRGLIIMVSVGSKIALFPCVCSLGDRTGRNHVQQIFPLTLNSRGGLMSSQAWVHVGHSHTCQETNILKVNAVDIK